MIASPLRREDQGDGRVRFWGAVTDPRDGRTRTVPHRGKPRWEPDLRVVTLGDGITVHNGFFDRDFQGGPP